jgi:probable O-glycosylation ligase (exosortase A-associated)
VRDLVLFGIVFCSLPFILARPWIGIIAWSWLAYMNPHRLTWGSAYDYSFSEIVAGATLIGFLFARDKRGIPLSGLMLVWLLWVAWMNLSTLFALNPDSAWNEWDRTMKIQLFSLLTICLIRDANRIRLLVLTIVASLGFYGIKGGLFAILTGGNYHVFGPEGSFIEGNNSLGLALVMTIPLMWHVYLHAEHKLLRFGLLGGIGLSALAILSTQSRGAFLAIAAMAAFLWIKSPRKLSVAFALAIAAPAMLAFMPEAWHERMASIAEYEQDSSAMGRINAWWFALRLALDHPFVGGGFQVFTPALFEQYAPDPYDFHDAHSIYFEVLAEHGFVGCGLFLVFGLAAFIYASSIARLAKRREETRWAASLASMIQVSLVGYAVGGAFLGLAYFDLYYALVAILVVTKTWLLESESAAREAVRPAAETGPALRNGGRPAIR